MCNIHHPKFLCRIYAKNVEDKDKAVQCDLCELWIHIKCSKLNYLNYRYVQNCDESWYSLDCAHFFLSPPYQAARTFWLVVQTLIAIS